MMKPAMPVFLSHNATDEPQASFEPRMSAIPLENGLYAAVIAKRRCKLHLVHGANSDEILASAVSPASGKEGIGFTARVSR